MPRSRLPSREIGSTDDYRRLKNLYRGDRDRALRDLYHVTDRDNPSRVIPFNLNNLQKALSLDIDRALALNKRYGLDTKLKMIVGKQRRGGVSSYLTALAHWWCNFFDQSEAAIVAHVDTTADLMMDFAQGFVKHWPTEAIDSAREWMKERIDNASGEYIKWGNGSVLRVGSAGGRSIKGGRSTFELLTEYAWYTDYEPSTSLLQQATPFAWIFKETTANGVGNAFHRDWKGAKSTAEVEALCLAGDHETISRDWNGYYKFFFSWLQDPGLMLEVRSADEERAIMSKLDAEELRLQRVFPELQSGQVKWRRKQIHDMKAQSTDTRGLPPEQYFAQDYPATEEDMFQSTGGRLFDATAIARHDAAASLDAKAREPSLITIGRDFSPLTAARGSGNLWIRREPVKDHDYAAGADACHGRANGDFAVCDFYDRTDGTVLEQVAMFRDRWPPHLFAEVFCALGEMFNTAFLTCESNDPGNVVCQSVFNAGYTRFYRAERLGRADALPNTPNTFAFGFRVENREAKALVIDTSNRALIANTMLIYHPRTIYEASIYQQDPKSRKLGAPQGEHDDCTIAMSLAMIGHVRQAGPVSIRAPKRAHEDLAHLPEHERMLAMEMARITNAVDKQNRRNGHRDIKPDKKLMEWERGLPKRRTF